MIWRNHLKPNILGSLILSILLLVILELTYADHWDGNIFVLEADKTVIKKGQFSMSGAAKKFYKTNSEDEYEMLLLFINFSAGGAFGTPIRNGTRGIGLELIEKGEEYGSPKRLEMVVLISSLTSFPDDPYLHEGRHSLLSLIAHEVGHRWLVFPDVDRLPLDSDELLGRNTTHWLFFANTVIPADFEPNPGRLHQDESTPLSWKASSCMEGNYWVENPEGTFTSSQGYMDGYSLFDQYLMGLVSDTEGGQTFVIHNPYDTDKTRESIPDPGEVVKGQRENVTVADIINAEGPRIPDVNHSQKLYKQAFVLVVKANSAPSPEEIAKLDDARIEWESYYIPTVTEGRLAVDTTNHTTNPNPIPLAAFTYTQDCCKNLTFDANTSIGDASTYYWDFGDGTTMDQTMTSDPVIEHNYPTEGQYMVSLVVSDGVHFSAPDTQPVNVGGGSECVVEITYINKTKSVFEVKATTTRSPEEAHMVVTTQNGLFTANMEYNSKRKFWSYKGSDDLPRYLLVVVEDRLDPQSDPPPAEGEPYCGRDEEYYGMPTAPEKTLVTSLGWVFPCPGNPDVWIPFTLAEAKHVIIRIYNAPGGLVRTLNLGHKPAGFYTTKEKAAYWDGKNEAGEYVSSGLYFYTIQAGEFIATKKMVIIR